MGFEEQKKIADRWLIDREKKKAKKYQKKHYKPIVAMGAFAILFLIGFLISAFVLRINDLIALSLVGTVIFTLLLLFCIANLVIGCNKTVERHRVYLEEGIRYGHAVVVCEEEIGPNKREVVQAFLNVGVSAYEYASRLDKSVVFEDETMAQDFVDRLKRLGTTAEVVQGPLICAFGGIGSIV